MQEVKDLTKKLYCTGGRYAIFHSGSLFTLFYMHYNIRSKRVNKGITQYGSTVYIGIAMGGPAL